MPTDYFEREFEQIQPCTSPLQTGCLISWDAIREGAWVPPLSIHRYAEGWESVAGKELYCVNPLSWTSDGSRVPASEHAGALKIRFVPEEENPERFEFTGLSPNHTWAQCQNGKLWVDNQDGGAFHDDFGVYHVFDINLFWMNVRENARARTEAYLRANGQWAES